MLTPPDQAAFAAAVAAVGPSLPVFESVVPLATRTLQSGDAGFDSGKGETFQQPAWLGVAWVLLSFSPFPVSNHAAPLCTMSV